MIHLCSACQKQQTETELCDSCIDRLEQVLAELPAQFDDLTAVATRQAAGPLGLGDNRNGRQWDGPFAPGALGDGPWVYAPGAADQLWAFEQTVTAWATHVAAGHGYAIRFRGPTERFIVERTLRVWRNRMHIRVNVTVLPRTLQAPTAVAAARWLQAWLPAIRTDPAAAQLLDELTTLHAENHRWSIGTSAPSQFAGTCDTTSVRFELNGEVLMASADTCGADLYAHEGDDTVRCHRCGHEYEMATRRAAMLAALPDVIAPTLDIANALTTLLEPVTPAMIRQMAFRREITSRGTDPRDPTRALYRVGDVLDVLTKRAERRKARMSAPRRRVAS